MSKEIQDRAYWHQQVLDSTPGRFEGEPDWTPYFYDIMLDGFGREEPDGSVSFEIGVDSIALFPELKQGRRVRVYVSDQGFVSTRSTSGETTEYAAWKRLVLDQESADES